MKRYYFERTGERKKNFVCGVVKKISEGVEASIQGNFHLYTFFEAGGPGSFRREEGSFLSNLSQHPEKQKTTSFAYTYSEGFAFCGLSLVLQTRLCWNLLYFV